MRREFAVLEAEPGRGFVVMVRSAGMLNPVGPRLLRGQDMNPKYLSPFHRSRSEAEEARDAWELYFKSHEKPNKKTTKSRQA